MRQVVELQALATADPLAAREQLRRLVDGPILLKWEEKKGYWAEAAIFPITSLQNLNASWRAARSAPRTEALAAQCGDRVNELHRCGRAIELRGGREASKSFLDPLRSNVLTQLAQIG